MPQRPACDLDLQDIDLSVMVTGNRHLILDNASLAIPRARLALIGESRVATVSVIDLLVRRLIPQKGRIRFSGRVSWPIGHAAPFSAVVTGKQVLSHFSALYGYDRMRALNFMRGEFEEPDLLHRPIETWPRLRQSQFMLLMSLVPEFDVYIVDANLVQPEAPAFSERFLRLFHNRTLGATMLMTLKQQRVLRSFCASAVIVAGGKLTLSDNLDAALEISDRITIGGRFETETDVVTDQEDLLL